MLSDSKLTEDAINCVREFNPIKAIGFCDMTYFHGDGYVALAREGKSRQSQAPWSIIKNFGSTKRIVKIP